MKKRFPVYALFNIAALLLALGFFVTRIWSFLILAVWAMILGLSLASKVPKSAAETEPEKPASAAGKKIGCAVPAFFAAAVFLFLTPPLSIRSGADWQYPFQRAFLSLYRYGEPEWFPDFMADAESDYFFEFMPSMLQGTGFYTVHFITTPARAAEYAKQFSDAGAEAVPLPECLADFDSAVRIDENFFPEPDAATVYVIQSNRNFNHPHSKTVTVDPVSGRVEITQYG